MPNTVPSQPLSGNSTSIQAALRQPANQGASGVTIAGEMQGNEQGTSTGESAATKAAANKTIKNNPVITPTTIKATNDTRTASEEPVGA